MSEMFTSPPPRAYKAKDLSNANARNLLAFLLTYCRWKSCLSVSELKQMSKAAKNRLLLLRWEQTVDSLKASEDACMMRCEMPTSYDWDIIIAILKTFITNGNTVCCN